MSYNLRFDAAHHLATAAFTGTVEGSELIDATRKALQGAAPGPLDVVWDATSVKELHLMPGDIEQILESQQRPPTGVTLHRHVFVVHRPLDRLVARLYATLAGRCGLKVHVCSALSDAGKLLGRTDLIVPPFPSR
jgi:hypothetical protein